MKITIDNFEISTCTAIAIEAEDAERQPALFIHNVNDEFCDGDCVVFGYAMPEDMDDIRNIFSDCFAYTSDYETLETVILDD